MKNIMMETAQFTCGLSKGPCRHKETWWWNEEVAQAVGEKKKKYRAEPWKELVDQFGCLGDTLGVDGTLVHESTESSSPLTN